jgi:U32 family peptidase
MKLIIDLLHIEDIGRYSNNHVDSFFVSDGIIGIKQEVSFSRDELSMIRKLSKDQNINMIVDVNAIYHETELDQLKEYLEFLKLIEVDSILFSDMAVYMISRELEIEHLLIYGSETFVTNNFEINYWLNRVQSAIISNELSIEELIEIANSAQKPVIYLAYGYHSMFYSKRELLTNYYLYKGKEQKQTKNNRKFRIVEELREEEYPIMQDERGTHIYTGKIFCMFREITQLKESQLTRLHLSANFLPSEQYKQIIELYEKAIELLDKNTFDTHKNQLFEDLIRVNPNINTSHLYAKSILTKGSE